MAKADLRFGDRDGHHWQGAITVEAVPADSPVCGADCDGSRGLALAAHTRSLELTLATNNTKEFDGTICSGHRDVATDVPLEVLVVMVVDGCA
jgi:hypothetical protein